MALGTGKLMPFHESVGRILLVTCGFERKEVARKCGTNKGPNVDTVHKCKGQGQPESQF